MEFNGTFLATIITFIVLVFVMNKILYAPILGIMEERKNFIDSNYKYAKENTDKVQELNSERESKSNDAKDDARVKYIETVDGFKKVRIKAIASAQDNEKAELANSKDELRKLSDEVKDGLKASMTNLASDIVEKVIGYRSEVEEFDNELVSSVLWDGGK